MTNWKATADVFESLIERPKMTQKLLVKPPFKYIFDIITQTTKKTGFANGLYEGEELKADYYGEKNRKITYLTKIITLCEFMSGEKVAANPQKIVAGMQPQQTNEFLQLLHKCATSGKSSDSYVKKVLGGGGAEQAESKPAQKKKIQRPPSAAKIKKPQNEQQKPQPPEKQPEKEKQAPPEKQKPQQGGSKKAVQNTKQKEKQKQKQRQRQRQRQKEKEKEKHQKVEQPKEEQPPVQQNVMQRPNKNKQEYSKKVQQLMEEGEQQVKKQKEAEVEHKNENNIAMGRLGGKRPPAGGEGTEKIISSTGQISQKQLDLVKSMIQSICQNTAPLGKSIEFINEDIESMNKQLQFWRKQYHASKTKMQNELKITEDALLPIYDKLGEIQDQIKDQKGKIQTAKAQIIKNDSTIKDLLMSVVTTK